ncbi:hypothetical protein BSL78_04581 [Apostichopus japonicus]|uniref:Spermatogenesis-associated protein 20-like TRX domain-containing protein n=1 Tax=Stichopus japonicus TaxID=307972 RepID=A0A2G8LE28_STIJA|nr:hypothetical protein BSL78_04581 [Apostichopus japonicus]
MEAHRCLMVSLLCNTFRSITRSQQFRLVNSHFIRTMASGHEFTNRLAKERSPYLLQHAHNPVDWYPWGEEAFAKAKKENKLIFLSVGYSTCHWCHVMERESFENRDIGKLMNEHFVNIKVDREERPDVDRVYMTFVQATSGGGGWPMSVWLTPDLKPVVGATYFPPTDKYGRPGFGTILTLLAKQWQEQRDQLNEKGTMILDALMRATQLQSTDTVLLSFLLRYHNFYKETSEGKQALEMCLHTMRMMAKGGVYDHVSQGFHRYSTDRVWHVPHFEKMLYDQGQLVSAYITAYQITKDEFFAEVAKEIIQYVCRDLSDESGGFYSAEDADSLPSHDAKDKKEGAFCVWTEKEVRELLCDKLEGTDVSLSDVFCRHFNVREGGNVSFEQARHLGRVTWTEGMIYKPVKILSQPIGGFIDDYAFIISALLDLYEASYDQSWLEFAVQLQEKQDELFWDAEMAGYFSATGKDDSILLRLKEDQDGAEPSGNSVAALNLVRLARLFNRQDWKEKAEKLLTAFSDRLSKIPMALPEMISGLMFYHKTPQQIIVRGERASEETEALLKCIHAHHLPNKVLLLADGDAESFLYKNVDLLKSLEMKDGKSTGYVCENFECQLPVNSLSQLEELLKK